MIVFTQGDSRLVPAQTNVITLEVEAGGYLYVDKTTYEQAVVIYHKYRDDYEGLCKLIGVENHTAEIAFANEHLPAPISYLAPFLTTLDSKVKMDGSLGQMVGCLHVISRNIDFTSFLRIPAEIRRSVSFNGHITEEYSLQWTEFINECVPYNMIYDVFAKEGTFANARMPEVSAYTSAPSAAPAKEKISTGTLGPVMVADPSDSVAAEIASDEDFMADFDADIDLDDIDVEAELAKFAEQDKKENGETTSPTTPPTPPSQPVTASVPEAASGKDLLDEWGL